MTVPHWDAEQMSGSRDKDLKSEGGPEAEPVDGLTEDEVDSIDERRSGSLVVSECPPSALLASSRPITKRKRPGWRFDRAHSG